MTKKLSEKQINDIVQNFENNKKTIDVLSQEFNCTKSTVIRNLKKSLGELKYKELKIKNNVLNTKSKIKIKGKDNLSNIKIDKQPINVNLNDLNTSKENVKGSDFYPVDAKIRKIKKDARKAAKAEAAAAASAAGNRSSNVMDNALEDERGSKRTKTE